MMKQLCVIVSFAICALGSVTSAAQYTPLISGEEVALYTRWLRADEDQTVVIAAIHEQFIETRNADYLERLRTLNSEYSKLLEEIGTKGANRGDLYRERFDPLMERFEEVDQDLRALEAGFFEGIRAVLHDEQLQYWPRVVRGRERMVLTARVSELPEGGIDLISMIDATPMDEDAYRLIETEFINSFEPQRIALLRRSFVEQRKRREGYREVRDLDYSMREEPYERQKVLAIPIIELKKRLGRPWIAACERALTLTRRGKTQLLEFLPEEFRADFAQRYLETAYPHVYPDALDAHRLFAAAVELDDLASDQRESVALLRDTYSLKHARLSSAMADRVHYRAWCNYADRPSPRGDVNLMWTELFELGEQREELNLRQIDLLMPVLTTEQLAHVPQWRFVWYRRPRPWDKQYERKRRAKLEEMGFNEWNEAVEASDHDKSDS